MLIFFILVLVILISMSILFRNYEKELIRHNVSKKQLLLFLYPLGMRVYDWIAGKNPSGQTRRREWAEAVYVRENPEQKLRLAGAAQAAIFVFCLFWAAVLGIVVVLIPDARAGTAVLERPSFGETESYVLEVEGIDNEAREVTVRVSGREPDTQGMESVFDEAFESLQQQILGENLSLEEVRTDLNLPLSTLYGIRVSWESLTPQYMDDFGKIRAKDIPADGLKAVLQVRMSYSLYESYYQLDLTLLPPRKDGEYILGLLKQRLEDTDQQHMDRPYVELPSEIEGTFLQYYRKDREPFTALPLFMLLLPFVIAGIEYQKQKEAYDKRNRQLIRDYPDFVFELGTMLRCHMTVRAAWERMVREYEERCAKDSGCRRFLYEEMIITRNQIEAGWNEGAAYAVFGRRCKDLCYLRLGSNLEQNVRQGISGLGLMLETELAEAMERQKNHMLQEGGRMEAKMLIPMFILLGLVMAILVIPAFMSM